MRKKRKYIIGIDEVGRGPLAGPITFCALAVPKNWEYKITELKPRDSKKLSPKKREEFFAVCGQLKKKGIINYSLASASNCQIDKKGLSFCIKKCVGECLKKLNLKYGEVLVLLDGGLKAPESYKNQRTIIKGDEKEPIISLASIIAKVSRDKKMVGFSQKFPEYGLEKHKGYGTKEHYKNIKKYGLSKIHRQSFYRGQR